MEIKKTIVYNLDNHDIETAVLNYINENSGEHYSMSDVNIEFSTERNEIGGSNFFKISAKVDAYK